MNQELKNLRNRIVNLVLDAQRVIDRAKALQQDVFKLTDRSIAVANDTPAPEPAPEPKAEDPKQKKPKAKAKPKGRVIDVGAGDSVQASAH